MKWYLANIKYEYKENYVGKKCFFVLSEGNGLKYAHTSKKIGYEIN